MTLILLGGRYSSQKSLSYSAFPLNYARVESTSFHELSLCQP